MRRRKLKKQRKIIIITSFILLFVLSTGYAAFYTNINLNAKGNIKEIPNIKIGEAKINLVKKEDGLYKDTYENKYIYKGKNPNNYISFNNELWRIISIESDGTIKIIKNNFSKEKTPFDENNSNVFENSTIKTYLNKEYYNQLNNKELITTHNFNAGKIKYLNNDLQIQILNEKETIFQGNIGLITMSEYIKANSNQTECNSHQKIYENMNICKNTNYLYDSSHSYWTINPHYQSTKTVYYIDNQENYQGYVMSGDANYIHGYIRPVLYLSKTIKLQGTGEENNPFKIIN